MPSAHFRQVLMQLVRHFRLYFLGYWIVVAAVAGLVLIRQHPRIGPRSSSVSRVAVGTSMPVLQPEKSILYGTHPLWCVADLRGVAAGSIAEFTWLRLAPEPARLFTVAAFYTPSRAVREQSYYSAPLMRGSYACRVQVNTEIYGSATFDIR